MAVHRPWVKLLLVAVLLAASALSSAARLQPVSSGGTANDLMGTPEHLVAGMPFDVAFGGGDVFWTEILGEFCAPPGSVKAVNPATHDQRTLVSSCDISPAVIVADKTHVYYVEWLADKVQRIPLGGGSPTTVASATGLIYHRALAVDDTYVYFGDQAGIKRVLKEGGAVITAAPGYDSEWLVVDDSYVYWTDFSFVDDDVIRRIPKTGGAVQTIVSGGSLADPYGIAVDDAYVYWTELDSGKARRVAKTGGTILDLVPVQFDYQAFSIAVDDEYVYWTDVAEAGGRLRRVPKGGGSVENLTQDASRMAGLNLSPTHLYWGDSGGLWRLQVGLYKIYVPVSLNGY
jgi:hypothetical protein